MAGKLISLEEAAAMLGVSPTDLSEMRQRQEVFGVRDGGGWKFKVDDIERLKSDRASGSSGALPLDLSESKIDVVLSEHELGDSGPGSSTVIGGKPGSDIELKLGGGSDSGLNLLDSGSNLSSDNATPSPGSAIDLGGPGSGLDLLSSALMGGSTAGSSPGSSGPLSDVQLASGMNLGGSGLNLGSNMGSNVLTGGSSSGGGADAGKTMLTAELADKVVGDSAIKMTVRDSESVFGEPDSDVSRHIEGSGINLLDARDSGLNLDDLQLASVSGIGAKKKSGGSDLEMKGEEDFLLTPLEEQSEDSTDSGSQVIALEGEFGDDATATLMAGDVPGLGQMLEDAGGMGGGLGQQMAAGPTVYAAPPEPAYGIGTVLALGFSSVVLTVVGIMMYDIIRHMWSWDTPYSFNSSLMDNILSMF
jgi:hypothetical protein